jgi:hypothetical protein
MKDGDDPAVCDRHCGHRQQAKLRYTVGPLALRVTTARRLVPAGAFHKQIRMPT